MVGKIVLFIALFCLVKGDIIADLNQQIVNLKNNIDLVIQNSGQLIGQTRTNIGQNEAQAEAAIHNRLNQLNTVVDQAKADAAQTGRDISGCLNALNDGLAQLDFNSLRLCRSSHELDLLRVQLGSLGNLKKTVSTSISRCSAANPADLEAVKECVQNEISTAQAKTNEIENQIRRVCGTAQNNAANCLETTSSNLNARINEIEHELKTCL